MIRLTRRNTRSSCSYGSTYAHVPVAKPIGGRESLYCFVVTKNRVHALHLTIYAKHASCVSCLTHSSVANLPSHYSVSSLPTLISHVFLSQLTRRFQWSTIQYVCHYTYLLVRAIHPSVHLSQGDNMCMSMSIENFRCTSWLALSSLPLYGTKIFSEDAIYKRVVLPMMTKQ